MPVSGGKEIYVVVVGEGRVRPGGITEVPELILTWLSLCHTAMFQMKFNIKY